MEFSAKQIAEYIQGIIIGDENAKVHTFAKIEEGIPGALSFLSNPKYTHYIYETQSSIVLVNKNFHPEHEIKATLIKVDDAYESLAKLMTLYEMSMPRKKGISSLASIAENVKIGKDVYIGPFVCIEEGAEIGDNVYIHPQATIGSNAKIGTNTILYPHCVPRLQNRQQLYSACRCSHRSRWFWICSRTGRLRENSSNWNCHSRRQCGSGCQYLHRPCNYGSDACA